MMLGDEAHLARGMASGFDDEMRLDRAIEPGEGLAQRPARFILTDQADEDATPPERHDVAGDIAGTADFDFAARYREHRRRRLRRNTRDFAIDKIIQHEVADAENGLLRHKLDG